MFNPARASQAIKEEFVDYIATQYAFTDSRLRNDFVSELHKTVARGPFLEIQDIFKSGKSLREMMGTDHKKSLSPLFVQLESEKPKTKLYKHKLPIDRKLYLHQEKAIKAIVGGNNVVISTGTGSGKTNCFLIPVINELLREKENGTLTPGIRALFIYPMNALANDQMKNIREILMKYPDITFGSYNGATEHTDEKANAVYMAMFANATVAELQKPLPNEILSREAMQESPPHILFTNYAMLEHLLLRPKDDVLFANARLHFVVLDEAHIYTGATGIETALLLSRFRARIPSNSSPRFILTSATLGSDQRADADIVTFAQNLCGVPFKPEHIIRAEREEYVSRGGFRSYDNSIYRELADEENLVRSVLEDHQIPVDHSKDEKELLYDFIKTSDLYDSLRRGLGRISELHEIQEQLHVDLETALAFVSLCARAQKNGKSLVDTRYHYFIRALEGCYMAFADDKKLFLNRRKEYVDSNQNKFAVFEIAICSDCGKIAIVGQIEGRKLKQSSRFYDDVFYFYIEDGTEKVELEDDMDETREPSCLNDDIYYLCPTCGSIYAHNERHNLPCECNSQHIKLRPAQKLKNGDRCMNCYTGRYERFYLGNDAATAVLATSLYEELPEVAYVETEVSAQLRTNMFAQAAMQERKKSPRQMSRQFLAFSDGRQEAAKFACYLDKSYKEFLRRRGICHVIKENRDEILGEQWTISDFVSRLKNYFVSRNTFATNNLNAGNLSTESRKNAWIALLNELARSTTSTSLCTLGQIQFEYVGNTPAVVQSVVDNYHITPERAKALLSFLVMEIVRMGAVAPDSDSEIGPEDRKYIFYTENQKMVTHFQPNKKNLTVSGWLPRAKRNQKGGYYQSKRLHHVCKALNVDEDGAVRFLEEYFTYLTTPTINPDAHFENINNAGTYVIRANRFRVLINGSPGAHWYKCKRCGRVTFFNIGSCPIVQCGGELEEVDPMSLSQNNHYAKLYYSDRMSPLLVKEHTAQLGKQESAEYQEQFIKKEINALSCSTTFEMGVDVGDLETVFLRDVPPLPSNYAQRAGRAGRSLDAAAFVLTFAKLSSHDFAFFRDPKKMIGGVILPPLFKVDNEKIVRRHIYAVALSLYFSQHPDQYNGNNAGEFINKQGYRHFIDWLMGYPHDLKKMLLKSIPDIGDLHTRLGLENFTWLPNLCGEQGVFTQMMVEYENNVQTFESLIKEFTEQGDLKHARSTQAKLWHYTNNKLIDFLARGNILPRYGFPVDTVELDQNSNAQNVVSKLRLSRDLQIAIAEYAPSSEIVADGKLYTSRYIKKSPSSQGMDWRMGYIAKCSNPACGTMNYSVTPVGREGVRCSACGQILTVDQFFESIEPRAGFVAEREAKEVPLTHQKKNFRSDDFYIGNQSARRINSYKYLFNDIEVKVESTANDSLLVQSSTNFYVCPLCGYTLSTKEAEESADGFDKTTRAHIARGDLSLHLSKKHDSLFGPYKCRCQDLNRRSLHHEFKTDVAKISFACDTSSRTMMLSVMYAILNAMAKDLNIERRDIKACLSLHVSSNREYSIIIYDAVPGGAGHSRRLVTEDGRLLHSIFMSALSSLQECNCDPSCYNCLRSYENQRVHDNLNRLAAIDFLSQFAGACGVLDFGI